MRTSVWLVPLVIAALSQGPDRSAMAQDRITAEQVPARAMLGDRVRITIGEGKTFVRTSGVAQFVEGGGLVPDHEGERQVVGSVKALDDDQVVVQDQRDGGDWLIFLSSVQRAELSAGMRTLSSSGFSVGLAVGLATGLLAVLTYEEEDCVGYCPSSGLGTSVRPGGGTVLLSTLFGGLVGAGVGALLRTERWEDASLLVQGYAPSAGPWARFGLGVGIPAGGRRSSPGGSH